MKKERDFRKMSFSEYYQVREENDVKMVIV